MINRKFSGLPLAALLAVALVAPVLAADPPAAPTQRAKPPAECLATLDRLSKGVAAEETGPALQSRGLKIRTPILVPESVITETNVVSGARIRVRIDSNGKVVPGSVAVQQSVGDPKLPLALSEAVPATLSFDVSGAFTVPKEFAFTTVYVSCARS